LLKWIDETFYIPKEKIKSFPILTTAKLQGLVQPQLKDRVYDTVLLNQGYSTVIREYGAMAEWRATGESWGNW
jgi:hypothetical protein